MNSACSTFENKYDVVSYNIGSIVDYKRIAERDGSAYKSHAYNIDREAILKEICYNIFNSSDIVLFQEVRSDDLPIIESVLPENFRYVSGKDSQLLDTMVLWDNQRFLKIEPTGQFMKLRRSAITLLADRITKTFIQAVSVHITGFDRAKLDGVLDRKNFKKISKGDEDIDKLISNLYDSDLHIDMTLIGGDFNAEYQPNPHTISKNLKERNVKLSQNRFTKLEACGFVKIDNGIGPESIGRQETGTCKVKDASIDHLFIRVDAENNITCKPENAFPYPLSNASINPSDHRPLMFALTQHLS